ncbi:MAG: division/cell wall cluster transcriptional repressor MraZ [Desulfosarcinaceae bacterium]
MVVMFRGSSIHNLDPKGRIIVPARFRDVIRAGGRDAVMITRMDKSLFAYTLDGWAKIEQRILDMADMSEHMRRIRRYFVGGAFECSCDKQGRVLIPPTLRGYAELEKEIVLVGLLDHFEIWSLENWNKENEQMEIDLQKGVVHEEIARLGL